MRSRLAYDEMLANQLVLALRRRRTRSAAVVNARDRGARSVEGGAALMEEGRRRLPFELTSSQDKGGSAGRRQ